MAFVTFLLTKVLIRVKISSSLPRSSPAMIWLFYLKGVSAELSGKAQTVLPLRKVSSAPLEPENCKILKFPQTSGRVTVF